MLRLRGLEGADRLEGKAVARVDLHTTDEPRRPDEIQARMMALITKHPDLLMKLIASCPPELRTVLDLAPIADPARPALVQAGNPADESASPPAKDRTPG